VATSTLRTFSDAVVLVTGGASGIGAALGRDLAARGAHVVLADRQRELAEEVAETIRERGGKSRAVEMDVRDAAAVEEVVASCASEHQRLDYIINNAGTGVAGNAKDFELDDWRYVVEVNLMGVVHGVQAAYPRMVRQGFGHIVNIASMAGLMPTPFTAVYAMTKHGVVGLSRSLRLEARRHGVRVSVVCPGVIRTPLLLNAGAYGRTKIQVPLEAQHKAWQRLRPMGADQFARAVVRDVARGRSIIIHPRYWRAIWWLNRLSPSLADAVAYRAYLSALDELETAARGAP